MAWLVWCSGQSATLNQDKPDFCMPLMSVLLPLGLSQITGPAGLLEVLVEPPLAVGRLADTVGVVCHPLPTAAGTMHNKVVSTTARSYRLCGMTAVRFQFRGVGGSEGQFDQGDGEQADLAAVITWVRQCAPGTAIWLAGFSFGAYVALTAAHCVNAETLIAIAPPIRRWDLSHVIPPPRWLVVQGDDDELIDAKQVDIWARAQPRPPSVHKMAATSHFFHRRLLDLQAVLQEQLRRWGA